MLAFALWTAGISIVILLICLEYYVGYNTRMLEEEKHDIR